MAAIDDDHRVLTILESCRVSPPPNTVGERSLTLTFLDLPCLFMHPVNRIFFYDFPHSTDYIVRTLVPNLKHSLSITLQHFFPFASTLVVFPDDVTKKPEIRHVEGDSIALTFAESSLDFGHLVGNHPRECNKFHPLVPQLESPSKVVYDDDLTKKFPIFAVQVTIFPNSGISIGLTNHHILCDASTRYDFLKAWTSITKNGNDEVFLASGSLPFYDRVIQYPSSLDEIYLALPWIQTLEERHQPRSLVVTHSDKLVCATFHLTRAQINLLKNWVLIQLPTLEYVLSFTVGCAYVWICMAKSRILDRPRQDNVGEFEIEVFFCVVDWRARLDPPIPQSYFGNCVGPCFATTKSTLLTENKGFCNAVEVLGKCIRETVNNTKGMLRDAETWWERLTSLHVPTIGVTGSPKFNVYDVDFGWGKPKKHEAVITNIAGRDVISVNTSKESPQDLEFSLSLCAKQMYAFISIFDNQIASILSHHE